MLGRGITRPGYDVDTSLVEPAATRKVGYRCAAGHRTVLVFAAEADEIPTTWGCRCGAEARTAIPDAIAVPVPRRKVWGSVTKTHLHMLHERRTIDELEALLAERLAILRGSASAA